MHQLDPPVAVVVSGVKLGVVVVGETVMSGFEFEVGFMMGMVGMLIVGTVVIGVVMSF